MPIETDIYDNGEHPSILSEPVELNLPLSGSYKSAKSESTKIRAVPKPLSFILVKFCTETAAFIYWIFHSICRYLIVHPSHATLSLLLVVALSLVMLTGAKIHDELLIKELSDSTVNKIIGASRFTRNYYSNNVSVTGNREFLRSGAPTWIQRDAVKAVLFNARRKNLSIEDQAVLLATVEIESGFNPMARASTTSACGLFQFVKATGLQYGLSPEDCMNPWLNAEAGINHYIDNYENSVKSKVENLEGIEKAFRTYELSYYLHHDGPYSSNPSSDVKATVLKGTQFMIQAYNVLAIDSATESHPSSFVERFVSHLSAELVEMRWLSLDWNNSPL